MTNNVSTILEGLNDEQRKAVQCSEGPVLIVAGAGSGKTRVLTSRVAYLLAGGCDPSRILALTFTKKAANEMKERIALMVGRSRARAVVMGTFHSVFVRFLREYAAFLGYPEQFTIYDQSDSTSAIKACVKELQLDDKIYKPREVLSRISMAKNDLVTVRMYRSDPNLMASDSHSKRPRLVDVYDLYSKKCKQSGVMDFDDILLNMNILLRDNPDALRSIADRFSYILVDEYQDTNRSQYLILKKLAAMHHNICVVGDDSQSIYAFRGARIENILNFRKDYPESKIFRLERNYRSTQNIVEAANSVISHNAGRIPKNCYSESAKGEKLKLIKAVTENEEASLIVSDIQSRIQSDHQEYKDFAILYRTNAQSRVLEEALRRRNIPYVVYSGNSFFERAEVKDLMAYFKLVVNPNDDESFKRVVNKPARGIGDTTVSQIEAGARENGTSLFRAASAVPKVRAFCDMINGLAAKAPLADAHELALEIADKSGLYAFYKSDTSIEGQSRTANVEELLNSTEAFIEERLSEMEEQSPGEDVQVITLPEFLENCSLLSNVDVAEDDEDGNNKVALMTVHSSKGLEFPYVFIAGMEDNLFPSGANAGGADIEEERRLFYVAITRAGRAVTLSFADSRMRNGTHEFNSPSRFLREIDSRFVENPLDENDFSAGRSSGSSWFDRNFGGGAGAGGGFGQRRFGSGYGESSPVRYEPRRNTTSGPARPSAQPPAPKPVTAKPPVIDADFIPEPMTSFKVGDSIEHNRFGAGKILELSGKVPELKAIVDFDLYGQKILLLKYAKMRHR